MKRWMLASLSALSLLTAAGARAEDIDFKDKLGSYPNGALKVMSESDPYVDAI